MKVLVEFYWWLRRLPMPRDWWYAVRAFIQRGRRGWADRDNWSMFSYLSDVMADMLKAMREKGYTYTCVHGAMGSEVRGEHMLDSTLCSVEDWHKLLHRMEFGLRYYMYVMEGDACLDYGFDTWRGMIDTADIVRLQVFADLGEYWGALWD